MTKETNRRLSPFLFTSIDPMTLGHCPLSLIFPHPQSHLVPACHRQDALPRSICINVCSEHLTSCFYLASMLGLDGLNVQVTAAVSYSYFT